MYKLDLHTHSDSSYDGGIKLNQYQQILSSGLLDFIAITDHNQIDNAVRIQKTIGSKIIVGEEVKTTEGEIIGLFLTEKVPENLSAKLTARKIKSQGGLVYIPHPFETVRSGVSQNTLLEILEYIDIIEIHNGRAVFQNKSLQALKFANKYNLARSASSDAHGKRGLVHTYTEVEQQPTLRNIVNQLQKPHLVFKKPPLSTLFYPKANRLKKRLTK